MSSVRHIKPVRRGRITSLRHQVFACRCLFILSVTSCRLQSASTMIRARVEFAVPIFPENFAWPARPHSLVSFTSRLLKSPSMVTPWYPHEDCAFTQLIIGASGSRLVLVRLFVPIFPEILPGRRGHITLPRHQVFVCICMFVTSIR
ncbi:hypothetical protein BDZ89DRAFT_418010 [Hymenopellis radicata]|nr:hypothetical protein BDZ89DRAFT_418010 [Hymenopellis radicata]